MTNATPEKILAVANELFAQSGYEGTSIRDIANQAGVNVAAVNYHFSNKQTLYWEIYLRARQMLEAGIEEMVKKEPSLEDLACEIFDFMLLNATAVKNAFKLILSDSAPPPPESRYEALCNKDSIGPPGGMLVMKVADKELGDEISFQQKTWLIKLLFTFSVHWILISSTSWAKKICLEHPDPEMNSEGLKLSLRHHVRASVAYLKNPPSQS